MRVCEDFDTVILLIDIQSKMAYFRLQRAQILPCGPSRLDTSGPLLSRAGRSGDDKQLFVLRDPPENVQLTRPKHFYSSVLQAWLSTIRATNKVPGMWFLEEPLFFNDFLPSDAPQSASVRVGLREAGYTKCHHLKKMMGGNITSVWLINSGGEGVCHLSTAHQPNSLPVV